MSTGETPGWGEGWRREREGGEGEIHSEPRRRETQGGGRGARGDERPEGRQRHAQGCEETHPQKCQGDTWRRRGRVGRAQRPGDTAPPVPGVGRGSLLGLDPLNPSCPTWNRGGILGGGCTCVSLRVLARGGPFPAGTPLLIPRSGPLPGPPAGRRLGRMSRTWVAPQAEGWPCRTPTSTCPVTRSGHSHLPSCMPTPGGPVCGLASQSPRVLLPALQACPGGILHLSRIMG